MSRLSGMLEQLRGLELDRVLGLRPAMPRVAIELDSQGIALVRLKPAKRGRPQLEAHRVQPLERPAVPATIFEQTLGESGEIAERLRALFDEMGVRPSRVSLVVPDNVAKVSLLTLPERPPSAKQLDEVVRFKMRRAVPFRLSDATISYQVLTSGRTDVNVLVAVARRAVVERLEQVLEAIGARPGLIDLCTPNLLNLCRGQLEAAAATGSDVALLNCTPTYFSLVMVRESRLIFFRCKTYAMGDQAPQQPVNGLLAREVAGSLSYYEEKLAGKGIGTLLVRGVGTPFEALAGQLEGLEIGRIQPIDVGASLDPTHGAALDAELAQRIAPALGAAMGRT